MATLPSHAPSQVSVLPAARQTFRNAHFTLWVDDRQRIVLNQRSDVPYATTREIDTVFDELQVALDALDRPRYALLVDMRSIQGRNDPEFDVAIQRQMTRWLGGFRRVGVFVRTAVGTLQVQRHAKQDGIERLVSTDEAALLRYLRAD